MVYVTEKDGQIHAVHIVRLEGGQPEIGKITKEPMSPERLAQLKAANLVQFLYR